jgi:hypothetical protein
MTMLQKSYTTARGRRRKFTPDNIQKIKDWVAQGISREVIAKSLDVSIGSLQVTCSRLGISLRIPKMFERRRPVVSHPYIPNHPPMLGHVGLKQQHPRFQIVVKRNGLFRCATDVPLTGPDIARLGIEAMTQNLGMGQLLTQAVTTAIKKNMIQEILGGPSQERASAGDR